jgi:hypothetical protein
MNNSAFVKDKKRVRAVEAAASAFVAARFEESFAPCSRKDLLIDLVRDLLHLARRDGIPPVPLALRALEHFVADEEAEEGDGLGPDVTAALTLAIEHDGYNETRTFGE